MKKRLLALSLCGCLLLSGCVDLTARSYETASLISD